jgi:hypothetical protein
VVVMLSKILHLLELHTALFSSAISKNLRLQRNLRASAGRPSSLHAVAMQCTALVFLAAALTCTFTYTSCLISCLCISKYS